MFRLPLSLSRSFVLCIILLLLSICVAAQRDEPEFGKVTLEELQLRKCELDSTADAMYLLNQQETQISPMIGYDFKTTISERVRIKVFNRNAYSYATIKMKFDGSKRDKDLDLAGYIYTLDSSTGQIKTTKIGKDDIFKQKGGDALGVSFTFPGVTPGCIIEYQYSYTRKSSFFVLPWIFQSEIPTRLAVCHISVPDFVRLEHRIVSSKNVDKDEQRKVWSFKLPEFKYSFSVTDIPAFKREPMMSSVTNNLQRIEFVLRPKGYDSDPLNQDTTNKWFYANRAVKNRLGTELGSGVEGTDSILEVTKKYKSVLEKVNYVLSVIRTHMKWDGVQTSFPEDVVEAWKNGNGTSADLNSMLYFFLYKAGVAAYPILYSTRENGKPDQSFVSLGQFDGLDVIVVDKSKTYVLDATQKTIPPQVTPFKILNTSAFLINQSGGQWVNISDDRILYRQSLLISSKIDSSGHMNGNASIEYYDFAKEERISDTVKKERNDPNPLPGELQDFEMKNFKRSIPADDQLPMIETFEFTGNPEAGNDFIFINPSFLAEFRKNPFTSDTRHYDIDLGGTQSLAIAFNLQLPPGLDVEELPNNITLVKSDSSIIFKRICDKQNNLIRAIIRIEYVESYFDKKDYPALKEFFSKMFGLLNQPIILKKKKN